MRCVAPISAWQDEAGAIHFSAEKVGHRRDLTLPCGQCVECRLERSRQWAVRCMHEAQLHESNVFVTLTYDEQHVPRSLEYRDFQLFMKKVRRRFGAVRFYMCGEYGERFDRPHFHACLFGLFLSDLVLFKDSEGVKLYTSKLLDSCWGRGFVTVGDVTFESAAYVARYVMKKVTGGRAEAHYSRVDLTTGELFSLVPEFTKMSLKPGIGRRWIEKYVDDVYNYDHVIVRGREAKPPRYYDKYLAAVDPLRFESLEPGRIAKAERSASENTPERLAVRRVVTTARLKLKRRSL